MASVSDAVSVSTSGQDTERSIEAPAGIEEKRDEIQLSPKLASDEPAIEKVIPEVQHDTEAEVDSAFVVWWQQPVEQDQENPMNWTTSRKWSIIGMLSFITFLT